jgi:aminoglycoside phosphotransferase (APT) family kinase protein
VIGHRWRIHPCAIGHDDPAIAGGLQVYVHCTDESVIGAEFYVMERVNGIILRSDLPAELGLDATKTEALCKSFIDKFVELHQVDYSACGLGDLGKPEGYVARQIRGWSDRYEKALTPDAPSWKKTPASG